MDNQAIVLKEEDNDSHMSRRSDIANESMDSDFFDCSDRYETEKN